MNPKSKIVALNYEKQWLTPQNRLTHVHNFQLENGLTGKTYLSSLTEFLVGEEVEYALRGQNYKFFKPTPQQPQQPQQLAMPIQNMNQKTTPQSGQHTITYYLGFTMGFAKDMAIEEFKKDPKAKEINSERFRALCIDAYNIAEELFNKDKEE